jgi:serine-type D-Ala-D-Ala carboxypeptidase/endopeptidase
MNLALKITLIVIGCIIVIVAAFLGFAYYKIRHIKDTHDLQARIDSACNRYIAEGKYPGMLVGVVQGDKVYIKGFGVADKEMKVPVTENTLFEIGSITKVFTTEIAQQLAEQKQLNWDDNFIKYLPAGVQVKTDDSTTLRHLASHTSGLPGLPKMWFPKLEANECDPYSTLTIEDVYKYLATYEEKKKPSPEGYEYSNLGMGLLGHILEWKTGKTYEALLQEYICRPLGMPSTSTVATDSNAFATGYDEKGNKTCHWALPVLYGAGVIKSNGVDMIKFLRANMGGSSALSQSFKRTQQPVTSFTGGKIAYGWHIDNISGKIFGLGSVIWHNGGTGGFRSYMGFAPEKNRGIIVMVNQPTEDFDDEAVKLLIRACTISLK